ncbi:hypothetical protein [Desulfopila sp. IMCC35008]|uniref:hypothetical protein n=1 Tax=Desulfopila sp. IMCC35008 TaxID=2653858 RepID=UPI0013D5049F|nr:hypothetical protein [Desulfopila sp. IMCC35008]
MELNMIFSSLILLIGAFHLAAQVSSFIQRYFFSTNNKVLGTEKKATVRDDWYLFFHCSKLTGNPKEKKQTVPSSEQLTTKTKTVTTKDDRHKRAHRMAC